MRIDAPLPLPALAVAGSPGGDNSSGVYPLSLYGMHLRTHTTANSDRNDASVDVALDPQLRCDTRRWG